MRPKRRVRLLAALAVWTLAFGLTAPASAGAATPPTIPPAGTDVLAHGSWIVRLEPGAAARTEAPGFARAAGGELGLVYEHALNGFQFRGSAAAADALRSNPLVASVDPDGPLFLTETVPFGIDRVDAWTFSGAGAAYQAGFRGAGARIAVLDTGIDLDHPDLAASIDTASGLNCMNTSLSPNDGHGHGTHVAGTAAAPLNGTGVVGIAPEATLVAIKMFDDAGNSSEARALCALDHIVDLNTDGNAANDIDVANMSWGEHRDWGTCITDPLHAAICAAKTAGITLVGGAGNDARDGGKFVPAAFFEVISVSGLSDFDGKPGRLGGCQFVPSLFWTECDDTLAFFSDWGPAVDVTAPGVNVYSTWAGGGYKVENGTSMSTPHVSGVVALMAAADPDLTPTEARTVLMRSGECPNGARADADGTAGCNGQGKWPDDPDSSSEALVNALNAAQAVSSTPPPPPPQPTAPAAPTLTSAAGGASAVTLSWSAPADGGSAITGYQVWRGTASGAETLLETVGVQESYIDSAVVSGTTYWYQVAALNAVGIGPRSNERSAVLAEAPSAPELLGAPADGAVALTWTEPADDGGSAVSGYRLYRKVGTGPEALHATLGADASYVDFAVTNGTEYTYRITAVNAAGEGASSNSVTVTPTSPNVITAPDPPQLLTGARTKTGVGVVLTWSAPADDGGSPISSYFVYRRAPGATTFTLIGLTGPSIRTYSDLNLAQRTTYTYVVTAFNTYDESDYSNQVSVRTK